MKFPQRRRNVEGETWTVKPNVSGERSEKHKENRVKTTKYTLVTFLPKNLFEQFHRFANVYFLFIIVLNWIPQVNAFGKEIAMIPLISVLAVTAVKDFVEDRRRYLSDRVINNRACKVYSSGKFVPCKWKNLCVGDLVELVNDSIIPADILLIHSTDDICHVSTANLDGETNLKQKQIPRGLLDLEKEFFIDNIDFEVRCEQPNSVLHHFNGYINKKNGEEIGVDLSNLLLRGCVVKNTDKVIGLVLYAGHNTKAMLNNSGPRYKRSRLEKDINKDVIACVFILFTFCLIGAIGCGVWTAEYESFERLYSTNGAESSPAYEGFLRFWTFIIVLQVIIPISLYVSVEIVKLGQVYFINNDAQMFYEKTAHFLTCRATNINEDLGQIQYVFSDKTGTLTENKMAFKRFSVAGVLCDHDVSQALNNEEVEEICLEYDEKLLSKQDANFRDVWDEFFTVLSICNTVVVSAQPDVVSMASSTTPSGYDDFETQARRASVGNVVEHPKLKMQRSNTLPEQSFKESVNGSNGMFLNVPNPRVKLYSKTGEMSDRLSKSINSINSWLNFGLVPTYQFESPDEGALVKGAAGHKYKLANRTQDQLLFTTPNDEITVFDTLHVLAFDSCRKRMSIIVRDDKGRIKVYSKGADSAFMNYLREGQEEVQTKTDEHLEIFAREGYRTLCIGKRELSQLEYDDWLEKHRQAELALDNREQLLADSAEAIETGFTLLGATAIEDRLQDGVPETIAKLRAAGIKVWILTGDKQETAVNIGFSSKLIDSNMELITINSHTKEECNELLDEIESRITSRLPSYSMVPPRSSNDSPPLALIIDGATLAFALENPLQRKFVDIAKRCESVICCRAAPLQKALVVKVIRENLKVMSLGIGDGANDVSMLQMAEIGVGIAGEEGVQAVMASDFVLGRFKYLQRLLLLHGFWSYDRTARMIVYFFYKNAMFVFFLFWYQLYNGFSGSNAIDDISLISFNIVFTSVPPIIAGVFDQNLREEAILARPALYQWGQLGKAYSRKLFWLAMLESIYQSIVLFFICLFSYGETTQGMTTVGILFHQLAVLTASLNIAIEVPNWTWIHVLFILGSVVVSYLYFFILCVVSPQSSLYYTVYQAMATSYFWWLSLICPIIATLPRLLYRVMSAEFFPSVTQIVRKQNIPPSPTIGESTRRYNGTKDITSELPPPSEMSAILKSLFYIFIKF